MVKSNALKKAQGRYLSKFDSICLRMPGDGTKARIQQASRKAGMSTNAWIMGLIEKEINKSK